MVSQTTDASLAIIFYTLTILIVFSLFGCYLCDVYKKSRRGDYYRNPTSANTTTTTTNDNTNTNNRTENAPNCKLQLCSITVLDEPLMGTIRTTILEDLEATTTVTNIRTVADFGKNVVLELGHHNENEVSCPICLNEYASSDAVFRNDPNQCRHMFHTECIRKWIQQQK